MKSLEISLDFCSALMSCGFAVSEVLWLGNFAFLPEFLWLGTFACLLGRLDGKDADSSSRAHRIAVFEDNVHWALVMVALDDSELASKKKRAGKTPGGLVLRFHHMLSVEQRWLEIFGQVWRFLALQKNLLFLRPIIPSQSPDVTRFAGCKIDF